MPRAEKNENEDEFRGQTEEANSLQAVVLKTVKLRRRHHLNYDQTKHVVEGVRKELKLSASRARWRTVERLDQLEVREGVEGKARGPDRGVR